MRSREKAVLAALRLPRQTRVVVEESLDELGRLAESAGALVVGRATQDRRAPTPGLYFGKGKVEEIKTLSKREGADLMISDDSLSPIQERNLGGSLGVRVIDRCNLTILQEPGQEELAQFLADHGVELVASMPCYLEDNVDRQRGKGTFDASIRALQRLNALGYAQPGSGLTLNLVYNPQGASLPPAQQSLEQAYKLHLAQHFGVVFNQLFTLANMPIQRFGSMLVSKGQFNSYMDLLRSAHRDDNLAQVMCRTLVSVDWQGYLYDCDFNQQLGLPIHDARRPRLHLSEVTAAGLEDQPIRVADHCFGCTAGQGSSCGGALEAAA